MGKERKYHAYFTSKAARNKDWYCEQGILKATTLDMTQGNGQWIWTGVTKNKGGQKIDTVVFNWIECNVSDFSTPFFF